MDAEGIKGSNRHRQSDKKTETGVVDAVIMADVESALLLVRLDDHQVQEAQVLIHQLESGESFLQSHAYPQASA